MGNVGAGFAGTGRLGGLESVVGRPGKTDRPGQLGEWPHALSIGNDLHHRIASWCYDSELKKNMVPEVGLEPT